MSSWLGRESWTCPLGDEGPWGNRAFSEVVSRIAGAGPASPAQELYWGRDRRASNAWPQPGVLVGHSCSCPDFTEARVSMWLLPNTCVMESEHLNHVCRCLLSFVPFVLWQCQDPPNGHVCNGQNRCNLDDSLMSRALPPLGGGRPGPKGLSPCPGTSKTPSEIRALLRQRPWGLW